LRTRENQKSNYCLPLPNTTNIVTTVLIVVAGTAAVEKDIPSMVGIVCMSGTTPIIARGSILEY